VETKSGAVDKELSWSRPSADSEQLKEVHKRRYNIDAIFAGSTDSQTILLLLKINRDSFNVE